jgi:hypothetical protein
MQVASVDASAEVTRPPSEDRRRHRRNRRLLALVLLAGAAGVLAYLGMGCVLRSYCPGPGRLLATAVLALVLAAWLLLPGSGSLAVGKQGLEIYRQRVPWDAMRTIAWVYEQGRGTLLPRIEIGLRDVAGYKSPRAGRLMIDPDDLDLSPEVFWEIVQERAKPHHVIVLSTPPGSSKLE